MHIKSLALALALAPAAIGVAHAATYTLTFTGADFATPETVVLDTTYGLKLEYSAFQSWPIQSQGPSYGGWLDFSSNGESIGFEAGNYPAGSDPRYLVASAPWYSVSAGGGTFNNALSFLNLPNNNGTVTITLTNEAYNDGITNPNLGGTDTLTLTAVPEARTWALMLLGFAGLGFVGFRSRKAIPTIA